MGNNTSPEGLQTKIGEATAIKKQIFSKEIKISAPVFLPEKAKNILFERAIDQYRQALPEVDFSQITSNDLRGVGVQYMLPRREPGPTAEIVNRTPLAFLETLNIAVSSWVEQQSRGKTPSLSSLNENVSEYSSDGVHAVWKSLHPFLYYSGYEKNPQQTMSILGQALFTGELQELRHAFQTQRRKNFPGLPIFNELLSQKILPENPESQKTWEVIIAHLSSAGVFSLKEKTVVLSLTGLLFFKKKRGYQLPQT